MKKHTRKAFRFLAWFFSTIIAAGTMMGCGDDDNKSSKYGPPTAKYGPPSSFYSPSTQDEKKSNIIVDKTKNLVLIKSEKNKQ